MGNRSFAPAAIAAVALLFCLASPARAVDFIRGDANDDGVVTVADAYKILSYLFHSGEPPVCWNAADANDSGDVDIADPAAILMFVFGDGILPPPFPAPGPDPTANPVRQYPPTAIDCASAGNGSVGDDPAMVLRLLDATAAGGADGTAVISIALTNPSALGAYSGRIRVEGDALAGVAYALDRILGFTRRSVTWSGLKEGRLLFTGMEPWGYPRIDFPAGTGVTALDIAICLRKGTTAGRYQLVLEQGEVVDPDTSRSIRPTLADGELVVAADVEADADCSAILPPPPAVNAVFQLGSVTAAPGGETAIPFWVRADAEVQGYSVSIDFDESVLEALPGQPAWARPDGKEYDFFVYQVNNRDDTPGNAGIDEGYVVASAYFDYQRPVTMPADTENLALELPFRVKLGTNESSSEIRFLDGGQGPDGPAKNIISALNLDYTPEMTRSFVFLDGRVTVIPDIATFVRGDANGDGHLDLSDAVATLSFLFQGGPAPRCLDAADVNDDGRLDLADPIAGLSFLFLDGGAPPPPFPGPGLDPTADDLGCSGRN